MSVIQNPLGILPTSDSPVIDFKGEKKFLRISFPDRTLNKDTTSINDTTQNVSVTLGEFIAFRTFGGKEELKNNLSAGKLSDTDKKKRLRFHLGLFLYSDAPQTSCRTISVIELKYYNLNLKYDGKPVNRDEGIKFIKEYIVKSMKSDIDKMIDYSLENDIDTLIKSNVKFLKDNFSNPSITNFNRFENEFLSERNRSTKIFKSFYEKYDVKKIIDIKKVVDVDEIIARLSTIDDRNIK